MICPKCGREQQDGLDECLKCGVIFSKIQPSNPEISAPTQAARRVSPLRARIGITILVLIFAVPMLLSIIKTSEERENQKTVQAIAENKKNQIKKFISLNSQWRKGGFGTVMEVDFVIKNQSQYAIKDIEIVCGLAGNSGTMLDSATNTIYEMVKAGESKNIPKVNMGFIHAQAEKAACSITNFAMIE